MRGGKRTGSGRPPKSANKEVKPIREKFQQLLDGYTIEMMLKDLKSLDAPERLRIVTGLAEYIVPKLQRSEIKNEDGNTMTIKIIRD